MSIGGTMEDHLERIQVFVSKEQKKELRKIAYEEVTSVSEEVRKAVAEYLERKRNNAN
jgi:phosphoribosyl-AMP cyclohydrolase